MSHLHRKAWLVLLCGLAGNFASAQEKSGNAVFGSVKDNATGRPIEFATVALLKKADSSLVTGMITDSTGKFYLDEINPGTYFLRCSFMGYETREIAPIEVNGKGQRVNAGVISLQPSSRNLKEVEVVAEKSTLISSIDRKVYNVDKDMLSTSGSASDVLSHIPSVTVDIDGGISLRGAGNVTILINGRLSPLVGKNMAEVLQQLPANSIERIEVITNPSAKYKPDGTGGIINIVLKKDTRLGTNATVTLGMSTPERNNGNLRFNYNPGNLNFSASYSLRRDRRIRTTEISRSNISSEGATESLYSENTNMDARPFFQIADLGLEYKINKKNTVGLSLGCYNRIMSRKDTSDRILKGSDYLVISDYDRLNDERNREWETEAALSYERHFENEDKEFTVEWNYATALDEEDIAFSQLYQVPSLAIERENALIIQKDWQHEINVDYVTPAGEDATLEMGYNGTIVEDDLDNLYEFFDSAASDFRKDTVQSSRFIYSESIHAGYVTFEKEIEDFGIMAGLRAEQAFIRGHLVTTDSLISNDYFMLFPSLHLAYALGEESELQLNYSRRVNRPDEEDLNPFIDYTDPRDLSSGNPHLKPEFIHSVEFGYRYQNARYTFQPSVYYRYEYNGFTSVTTQLNDSTLFTTMQNLSDDRSAGVEMIFSFKVKKFISGNLSSNVFYNEINASNLGFSSKKSIVTMSSALSMDITARPDLMFQVHSNYRSARLTPQGQYLPVFVMNAGVKKDFMNRKLTLVLTVSDIFKTLRQQAELDTYTMKQTSIHRRNSRIAFLSLSWRFGKAVQKNKEEGLKYDNSLQ